MLQHGVELESRDLDKDPLSEDELDALIGARDYKEFLNPRNQLYREKQMKERPPTRAQAIQMMAKTPNLIRRPVVIRGGKIVLGFDADRFRQLIKS